MQINTTTNVRVLLKLECIEYWNECLLDSRAERRDLILDKSLTPDERKHCLSINSQVTRFVRKRLSEAQHDHVEAMRASADRIAQNVTQALPETVTAHPANNATFDVYEGRTGE